MRQLHTTALLTLFGLPAAALAQGLDPVLPLALTEDFYVSDPGTDSVYRLQDTNYDGDFNDPGEVVSFYDETLGSFALGNNNSIVVAANGQVLIADTSSDQVISLLDLDGDGNANTAGESIVFFDGDPALNAEGLEMVSPNGIAIDAAGTVWVAEANNSAGLDSVLRLTDLNGDGDANDLGEAARVFVPTDGGGITDVVLNDIVIGLDGHLYLLEGGSSGFLEKGIYRLDDADGSGDFVDSERAPFFIPPSASSAPFLWALSVGSDGSFYLSDTGNDVIWQVRDDNGDNTIDPVTEATQIYIAPGNSLIWSVQPDSNGALFAAESQTPDRILRLFDDNGDGTIDPVTEVTEVYSESVSGVNINNPRDLVPHRRPTVSNPPTAAIAGSLQIDTQATVLDAVTLYYAGGTVAPTLAAPFGFVELDGSGPFGLLGLGLVPGSGVLQTTVAIPDNPALAGLTFYVQGLAGSPARYHLTNATSVTLQ